MAALYICIFIGRTISAIIYTDAGQLFAFSREHRTCCLFDPDDVAEMPEQK